MAVSPALPPRSLRGHPARGPDRTAGSSRRTLRTAYAHDRGGLDRSPPPSVLTGGRTKGPIGRRSISRAPWCYAAVRRADDPGPRRGGGQWYAEAGAMAIVPCPVRWIGLRSAAT